MDDMTCSEVQLVPARNTGVGTAFQTLPAVEAPHALAGSKDSGRILDDGRIDLRSETSSPMSGAARRSWSFLKPLAWGGEPGIRLEGILAARCLGGRPRKGRRVWR